MKNAYRHTITQHGIVLLTGEQKSGKDIIKTIAKPNYYGVYLCIHKTHIMLWHLCEKLGSTLQSHFLTYTDTDSMHITGDTKIQATLSSH